VRDLPVHAHVLETDAPDMAPAWRNGSRNSPTELPRIAEVFADLREIPLEEACAQTGRNAMRVMPRLAALQG